MLFDDRLATVLRHRAEGKAAARTQFRQLLDLLGNRRCGRDESLQAAAWLRLSALGEIIPARERAAIVSERGWRFHNPQLAAHLADAEPDVASAALQRADLSDADWTALIPHLPVRARGFLRLRDDMPSGAGALLTKLGVLDRGLPQPDIIEAAENPTQITRNGADWDERRATPTAKEDDPEEQAGPQIELESAAEPGDAINGKPIIHWPDDQSAGNRSEKSDAEPSTQEGDNEPNPFIATTQKPARASTNENEKSEIAELVDRIARFRRESVQTPAPNESSPRLPLEDSIGSRRKTELSSFSFVADTAGRIEWADASVAAMLIGKRLMPPRQLGSGISANPIAKAFATHQPINHMSISLDGAPAITDDWIVTAQPRFSRIGGRFHGYVGRMRRSVAITNDGLSSEADRVRQLLHELRTPVNALQGFAEIIQQQLFGPAPNEYRALAANIAGDAARILAGFDELERLARLESGALTLSEGHSDLSDILLPMAEQLQVVLAPRMAGFSGLDTLPLTLDVTVARDDAEAMIWRVMATLAGSCATAETLTIRGGTQSGEARIDWQLPEKLLDGISPFAAQIQSTEGGLSAGLFGVGFSLRLARAEARVAGGDLVIADDWITLVLPLLTETESHLSPLNVRKNEEGGQPGQSN